MCEIVESPLDEGYRILEHPADVGVEAWGSNLSTAFEEAALGLVSIIVDPLTVEALEQRFVSITGTDRENLLVRWLSEIVYWYDGEDFLVADVRISSISDVGLQALLRGEPRSEIKHRLRMDVKAVTYHQLSVRELEGGYHVKFFLDV